MPGQKIEDKVTAKFSGGLNQSVPEDNIADDELSAVLNYNLAEDGSLESSKGPDQFNSTLTGDAKVTSIYFARNTSGTSKDLLVTTLDKIYKDDGLGGWTDITGATALTSGAMWAWRTFNNTAIGVNGNDPPQKYNFATVTDLGGSPPSSVTDIEIFVGRVVLSGDTGDLTAVHFCAVDDSEDWTAVDDAFTIFVDKDNGQPVIACRKFFDDLIIFKRKGIYRLINPDNSPGNMVLTQVFDDVGCVSRFSIKQIGNELVWLDDDGIYALRATQTSGDVAYSSASRKIKPTIDNLDFTKLDEAYAHDVRDLNQYRLSVTDVGNSENNRIIVRDYFHAAWLMKKEKNYSCFGKAELSSALFDMAGGYNGKVYKLDQLDSVDGDDYEKSFSMKRFHLGMPHYRKLFQESYIEIELKGTYSLAYTADFDYNKVAKSKSISEAIDEALWDVAKWDEDNWAQGSRIQAYIRLNRKGRNMKPSFYNNQAEQSIKVFKHVIMASKLGKNG